MDIALHIESNEIFNYNENSGEALELDAFIEKVLVDEISDENGLVAGIVSNGKVLTRECMSVETIMEHQSILRMVSIEKGKVEIIWHADI